MEIAEFAQIEEKFRSIVDKIVWCNVCTVDRQGRPRSRMLHPIWEGSTGWIATGRNTLKTKHLAANPFVSLTYWDPDHEQTMVECKAEWQDDPDAKTRVWELFKNTPPPMGYDLAMFWPDGPTSPEFGLLKLTPWRLEIWSLAALAKGEEPTVWRQAV